MNIVFFGTPLFAKIVFDYIKDKHSILAVVTQMDKPVGRKMVLTPPIMKTTALESNLKVFQPEKLDSSFIQTIKDLKPEAIVVVAYGKILNDEILNIAPCLNVHASILPKFRGASPIQSMILSDEKEFGVSIMKMDSGLDSGDIFKIASFERSDLNAFELGEKLAILGAETLNYVLNNLDSITPQKQDSSNASYCKKIKKSDGLVEFDCAKMVFKKYLAFFGWPGIFLESGLKLFEVSLESSVGEYKSGEILEIDSSVLIGCKEGKLRIKTLQAPNKNKINAKDYLKSQNLKIGDILK